MKTAYLLVFLVFGLVATALANQQELLQLDSAFAGGEYEKVELLSLRLLHDPDSLQKTDRVRVNLVAGYALIMLGREPDAKTYFSQALDADPNLELDPVLVSPKFKGLFDEVKATYKRAEERQSLALQGLSLPSRKALLYNLVVPGSGQFIQGSKLRGAVITTVQVASLLWFLKSLSDVHDSRSDYLKAATADEIAARYKTYDDNHRMAWAAGILTGAIYLSAQADLILFKPRQSPPVKLSVGNRSGLGLQVTW
jgi:hypothetical protein